MGKDTLTKWYDEYKQAHNLDDDGDVAGGEVFVAYQAGVTKAAVSMRARAMACVEAPGLNMKQNDIINHIKNKIGELSDIPKE